MASIDRDKAESVLNRKLAEYQMVKRKAVAALATAAGNERIGLLNVFLSAVEKEAKLLQDAGLLPKDYSSTQPTAPHCGNGAVIILPSNGREVPPIDTNANTEESE